MAPEINAALVGASLRIFFRDRREGQSMRQPFTHKSAKGAGGQEGQKGNGIKAIAPLAGMGRRWTIRGVPSLGDLWGCTGIWPVNKYVEGNKNEGGKLGGRWNWIDRKEGRKETGTRANEEGNGQFEGEL